MNDNTNDLIWNDHNTNTIGGLVDALCSLTDEQDGANFMNAYRTHLASRNPNWPAEKVSATAISNVGYVSGYCGRDTANRIMRFTGGVHPIFGGEI